MRIASVLGGMLLHALKAVLAGTILAAGVVVAWILLGTLVG